MKKKPTVDRRRFLMGSAALAGAVVAAPSIIRAADRELRVLTWEGYAEPEWLETFKQTTGATVNVVYIRDLGHKPAARAGSGSGRSADFVARDLIIVFESFVVAQRIGLCLHAIDPSTGGVIVVMSVRVAR